MQEYKSKKVWALLLFYFCTFLPSAAFAIVAYDNSATNQGDLVPSLTITGFTVAATNPLILCASATHNQTTIGVTFNSVAMTQVGSTITQAGTTFLNLWRLVGQSGTHNVVFTFATDITLEAAVGCASFTGVDQTTPIGTEQTGTGYHSGESPITITVPTNGLGFNAVAAFGAGPGCGTLDPDGGSQTERYDVCYDNGPAVSTQTAGATISATNTPTWTDGGGAYTAQIGVPINEVAAAPTGVARRSVIGVQ